ncbi:MULTISPECIES: enoyl-CoA hydratase/isomerase family protein [unclassified Mesorhizobium]|uniref:enoyl-CoA hydratase/isomerase family protein n=1 Tax=unclassified Mesorhizobium TaxID=325217 RepID=UPI0003CE5F8C|nr:MULTISPECIES: enoyl-CoA hydratase/isomerase family protein [unclassified Mesorhizobium]ESY51375.1 enoyl-CoA hydratase [Mesorhizobium sp. LNJC374B00]ESY56669.1 enoyl-CoA hydratase [Mesorhizobium sp. LNJC372A00]WJI81954.1 enoyl-CoA hydratase/isomerase family protein [Mesorhizobium sp. C374B]WJI88473.1 enoyl-CoA hydratase/isomerase family protein [Mesorhizobium sp. C372A]
MMYSKVKKSVLLAVVAFLQGPPNVFGQETTLPSVASAPLAAILSKTTEKIRLTRKSEAYWEVTFNNPPLNIIGPSEVRELAKIVGQIEADGRVKVVVFDSAVPGYFIAHYDLLGPLKDSTGMEPGPTGMHPVPDVMVRISRLKAATIVSIRGRASGIGSELALAADMRFASREKAVVSQFEVGAGFVPGGGPMARLPRLVGRGRAIEMLIGAEGFDGELAERYGYVNRALPDSQLDSFVDALATRIASFDGQAIADAKTLINQASLPPDSEMQPGWDAFITSVQRPAAQARLKVLVNEGLQRPGKVERNLNEYTAKYR